MFIYPTANIKDDKHNEGWHLQASVSLFNSGFYVPAVNPKNQNLSIRSSCGLMYHESSDIFLPDGTTETLHVQIQA